MLLCLVVKQLVWCSCRHELQQRQHQTTCEPKWEPLQVKEIVLKLTRGQAVHVTRTVLSVCLSVCSQTALSLLLCLPAAAPPGTCAGHGAAAPGLGSGDSSGDCQADPAGTELRALAAKWTRSSFWINWLQIPLIFDPRFLLIFCESAQDLRF